MSDPVARLNTALEGRYAIERELGEGGMATVYLADDLKHERKVALKVLKPELAAVVGAERFLAEIKTTANLTHPHILPLHDSGEADGFLFYVMPYLEGETLGDRIEREKQLPVDEAVALASKVAGALQHAHEHGVIHRDIKPANILLQGGEPVVADFGIALALGVAGGTRLTETGLSVGTPFYMSPEQATGDQAVGASTDTYALGSVLYEMLVGEPPYPGATAQAVLGKIIAGEAVSATKQRPSIPPNVDAAVRKALEKLPADRFASAQDFGRALGDEHFRYGELAAAGAGAGSGPWKRLSAGLTGLLAVTLVVLTSSLLDQPAPEVMRFSVPVGRDAEAYLGGLDQGFGRPTQTSLRFSPDGDLLVYSARGEDSWRLYLQRFDQERGEPIEGAEGGGIPFFSPDGAWIGFAVGTTLKRVSVADGDTETIVLDTQIPGRPFGATWGDDGTIVIGIGGDLYQVAATGGEFELLVEPDTVPGGLRRYAQPHMLPGSEALLFHASRSYDPQTAEIRALDLATGAQKTVLTDAMDPRYVQTGHLLFARQGTLMAVGFDPERVEVQGQPVIMLEDVMHSIFMPNTNFETGAAQVAVSASGHLAYALGGVFPGATETAVRVTVTGDTVPLDMDPYDHTYFRVSPDGDRLAFTVRTGGQNQIWVHDLIRGVSRRLNTGGLDASMAWSPDGRFLAFSSYRDGDVINIYRLAVDGSGEPERLAPSDLGQVIASWSSNGVIAFLQEAGDGVDIWVLPTPDGTAAPFFTSAAEELFATFSPDGQWLAYLESGSGIYVRPYPGPEPATQISEGGRDVAWSPDGRQIYYIQDRVLMAVDVTPADEFQAGRPVPLIDPWTLLVTPTRGYDVFPDGSFVTRVAGDGTYLEQFGATELHVVFNWFEELRQRMGSN